MKKIGNDGFAITGILYTLFALFLMVLFSVLAGLSSRKNMLEKTTSALNESYVGKEIATYIYENNITLEEYKNKNR